jgi:hypothetical protein
MPELKKRDDALWLRHLRSVGIHVPVGKPACLCINGREIQFEPMRPDRNGRLTHGLKASGRSANHWQAIPKGTKFFVDYSLSADEQVRPSGRGERPPSEELPRAPVRRSNTGALRVGIGGDELTLVSRPIGLPAPLKARGAVTGLDVG